MFHSLSLHLKQTASDIWLFLKNPKDEPAAAGSLAPDRRHHHHRDNGGAAGDKTAGLVLKRKSCGDGVVANASNLGFCTAGRAGYTSAGRVGVSLWPAV
jgi:hypothetical protein